jgi:hypothetical protein
VGLIEGGYLHFGGKTVDHVDDLSSSSVKVDGLYLSQRVLLFLCSADDSFVVRCAELRQSSQLHAGGHIMAF